MLRVQMLDEDDGEARIGRQALQQIGERLKPPRRRAYSDHGAGVSRPFVLSRGSRDRQNGGLLPLLTASLLIRFFTDPRGVSPDVHKCKTPIEHRLETA